MADEQATDEPYAKVIASDRNAHGTLCGLCDGTHEHAHPRVECSRCGKQGLRENWPFRCCIPGNQPAEGGGS